MADFLIIAILLPLLMGAILGRRFAYFVLVPSGIVVVVVVAMISSRLGAGVCACAVEAFAAMSCLQLGYFVAAGMGGVDPSPYRVLRTDLKRHGENQ